MAERRRIALICSLDKVWIGGAYYVLNLITSFNTLQDENKPVVVVVCHSEEDIFYIENYTKYSYLEFQVEKKNVSFINRVLNRVTYELGTHNPFLYTKVKLNASVLFPVLDVLSLQTNALRIAWIPDFQELHYPEFFTKRDLRVRDYSHRQIIQRNVPIVFSSNNALDDCKKNYPQVKDVRTFVLRFAVSLPERNSIIKGEVLRKYGAESIPFFFCANQFWQHKNHLVLFKAIKLLKDKGITVHLFCSGNTSDYRNPQYYPMLQSFIKENEIEDQIHILGFMDRAEQLCLMENSIAIVQPSLFEGWSTVVEDAKALHKYVLLSDIPLHREQLTRNVSFFAPSDSRGLASIMKDVLENAPIMTEYDYAKDVKCFATNFIKIVNTLMK